jgi:hypothetical protein
MTFKPAIWKPIAIVLSAVNLAGAGFAVASDEPWHATLHVALAVALGAWARHLRPGSVGSEIEARLEALEIEMGNVRGELSETHERLDFAERLLAQGADVRRVGPER